jgi:hypothetical protein
MRASSAGVFAVLLAAFATAAIADDAIADDAAFTADAAVPERALDEVRGGFEIPENLQASVALARSAFVNGERVAHSSVRVADIGNMTASEAGALAEAFTTMVVQNGPANTFGPPDLGPASLVIQNSLNDQHLVALTTLNVEVNTLGAFREINFQDGLTQTLGAIGGVR